MSKKMSNPLPTFPKPPYFEEGKRERVGLIGVDAGMIFLGDPCYLNEYTSGQKKFPETWKAFCEAVEEQGIDKNKFACFDTLGVAVSSGHGDGVYPVFVERTKNGIIKSVTVEFLSEEKNEE